MNDVHFNKICFVTHLFITIYKNDNNNINNKCRYDFAIKIEICNV